MNQAGSAAFYVYGGFGGSTGVDLKNNIFINTRDEGQQCASAIYDYNISNLTSDYNDLYYQTNQYNCLVRIAGTTLSHTCRLAVNRKDMHSYIEMPHFIEPYLEIDPTIPTYLESRGIPIAGIETDYKGDARNAMTPDIGADEFDGVVDVEDEITLSNRVCT